MRSVRTRIPRLTASCMGMILPWPLRNAKLLSRSQRQNLLGPMVGMVFFCCFDGSSEGCDRSLCFGFGSCCSLLFKASCDLDDEVWVGEGFLDGFGGEVAAVLADGGEDFVDYPCFELFCFGELGVEDQSVEVTFGDEAGLLCSTWSRKGSRFGNPLQ